MTREERQVKALAAKRKRASRKQYVDHHYSPLDLICSIHNVKFVNWTYIYPQKKFTKCHSHGCPVCVGLIRAKVRMEINRNSAWNKNGRRYLKNPRRPNAPTKRGRPKTKTIAAIVETRDGI